MFLNHLSDECVGEEPPQCAIIYGQHICFGFMSGIIQVKAH